MAMASMGPAPNDRAMSSLTMALREDLKALIMQTATQRLVEKVALAVPRPPHRLPLRLLITTDHSHTAIGDRTSTTLTSPVQRTSLQGTIGTEARLGEALSTAKLAILTREHPPHLRAVVTSPLDLAHPAVGVVATSHGRAVVMINRKMTIRKESLIIVVPSLVDCLRRPKAVRSVINVLSLILPVTHPQAVVAVVEVNGNRYRYRAKVVVGKDALSTSFNAIFIVRLCLI